MTYDQEYYLRVRKWRERPSRRSDPNARCKFCDVFLTSKFGSKTGGRLYCDGCRNSKAVKRKLNALYQKRAYHKRKQYA